MEPMHTLTNAAVCCATITKG